MARKQKRRKSVIVRFIVLGVSIYMVATLASLWGQLAESRATLEALEAQRDAQKMQIEELRALLTDGSHADIIEKAARERLGYVYSDEEIYIDISGN